ncbi:MAG: hypothetical protein ACPG4T_02815 [Nannocystaceae bacterium]
MNGDECGACKCVYIFKCVLLAVTTWLACAPEIPAYEGDWDDGVRKRCGNGEIDFHLEE